MRSLSARFALIASIAVATLAHAQGEKRADSGRAESGSAAPVVVGTDTVFRLYGALGPFTPAERAAAASRRIESVAALPGHQTDSVTAVDSAGRTDLVSHDVVLVTILDDDAAPAGIARADLARLYAARLTAALHGEVQRTSLERLLLGLLYTAIAVLVLIVAVRLVRRIFPRLLRAIDVRRARVPGVRIQSFELLSPAQLANAAMGLVRLVRFVVYVVILYVFVTSVLGFFPRTAPLAHAIAGYVVAPLQRMAEAVLAYLPNVFFIAVTLVVTRYALRAIHLFFDALERGAVELPDFDPEWAQPTYKIVRFLVLAFVVVMVFPYLPGAGSDAFKGVSLFLGALFTIGSSSAIANVVAGTVLTYTRAFRVGDRVLIGGTTGDVTERSLLVTRVRTIKNEEVTIPNAMVLSSHITNYTTMALRGGVILHTGVTIGYDTPWQQVHDALLAAARGTDGLLAQPEPFVLQTALDDFYVSYQVNAYTDRPAEMAATYSRLHANIQDRFAAAGLEIMSPHYRAVRDGNAPAMPGVTATPGQGPAAQGSGSRSR